MKKTIVLSGVLVLLGLSLKAQSADTSYQNQQYIKLVSLGKHTVIYMGDQRINFKELTNRLNLFPNSAYEFKKYKAYDHAFWDSVYAFDIGYLGAGLTAKAAKTNPDMRLLNQAFGIVFTSSIIPLIGTRILFAVHLKRAIKLYNKDIRLQV
ncbi:MAG TPA: hypothetical protein VNZ49_04260 [Bacteroidia bacterium]|jgi:hypothetical protein|nr:hypothetical protein [Bacteroidia bacterium]